MARPTATNDQFVDLSFPLAGIDRSGAFGRQRPRPMGDGNYGRTTLYGQNVRAFEPRTGRARGGSRSGLSRYRSTRPGGAAGLVQSLSVIVGTGYDPPGGGAIASSQSRRVVSLVAVIDGVPYVTDAQGTAWASVTNDTGYGPPLNSSGVIRAAANNQRLYFADGLRWAYYDPSVNEIKTWGAETAGTLPQSTAGVPPRLICTWRGRTVLAGLESDPQNWFMSAVGDPHDWDYFPDSVSATQAVAGNNSNLGLVGDVVTGLVPYTDDLLIVLCDSSLWQISGDPMAGGKIDQISGITGGAWGTAWCRDPFGGVYFFGQRGGIYHLVPGRQLVRVSQPIEQYLQDISPDLYGISMAWDDRQQALHVFCTALAEEAAAQHFCFEQRSGAWWVDRFADPAMNPLCCVAIDGNEAADRAVVIGAWDGWVRSIDSEAEQDDGEPIESEVWLGPLTTPTLDDVLVNELQAVLGEESGQVEYAVHVGASAEQAAASAPVETGTWSASRNPTSAVRRAGHAVYLRLTSRAAWQIEAVRIRIKGAGKVRRRKAY